MKVFLGIVLSLVIVSIIAWKIYYPSGSWRYKITIEVETPEGIKTGSAVRQIDVGFEPEIFPEQSGFLIAVSGESVVVDLGKRGILFAVMDSDGSYYDFYNTFAYPEEKIRTPEGVRYFSNMKAGTKALLQPDKWPQIVMFKDINDAKSVMLVRGKEFDEEKQEDISVDRSAEIFGKGVMIKSIAISITNEPVTRRIKKILPSYDIPDFQKWYNDLPYKDSRRLHIYDFTK